jgi:Fe2+ or Zn2+ uptake regulation protein
MKATILDDSIVTSIGITSAYILAAINGMPDSHIITIKSVHSISKVSEVMTTCTVRSNLDKLSAFGILNKIRTKQDTGLTYHYEINNDR